MNRRQFLQLLSALGVATQLPPLPDLDDSPVTPELVKQFDGESFCINFPNGTSYRFRGRIAAVSEDAVQIMPLGELKVERAAIHEDDDDSEMDEHFAELLTEPVERVSAGAESARGVELWRDDRHVAEIAYISPTGLTRVDDGMLQHGAVTFAVQWKADALQSLAKDQA